MARVLWNYRALRQLVPRRVLTAEKSRNGDRHGNVKQLDGDRQGFTMSSKAATVVAGSVLLYILPNLRMIQRRLFVRHINRCLAPCHRRLCLQQKPDLSIPGIGAPSPYANGSAFAPLLKRNAMTQAFIRSFFANLWRRVPITMITIGLVIASWTYSHFSGSLALRSNSIVQDFPSRPSKFLPTTCASNTQPTSVTQAPLSRFRRVRVAPNEVDYIAEDVTMRVFTPRPKPHPVRRWTKQVDIGDDVTIRYFADKASK